MPYQADRSKKERCCDLVGKQVRLLTRLINSGGGIFPIGQVMTIAKTHRGSYSLDREDARGHPHCRVSRVHRASFVVIKEEKKATAAKGSAFHPEPTKPRLKLNDRQCRIFLKDVREFGYTNTTFDEIRKIADQVADGTASTSDPIAIILCKQLDEIEEIKRGRK